MKMFSDTGQQSEVELSEYGSILKDHNISQDNKHSVHIISDKIPKGNICYVIKNHYHIFQTTVTAKNYLFTTKS
jgi:hypothetical protein